MKQGAVVLMELYMPVQSHMILTKHFGRTSGYYDYFVRVGQY
jgi:hypothetical protein